MKRLALLLFVASLWSSAQEYANAQIAYVTYYQPAVTFYQPATVYRQPATVYRPVVPACATTHTVRYVPAPVVSAPVVPAVAYQPVAQVRTRYRPFLGGTVSRVRYGHAPVVVAY
ncbi:MAG TPA: hypothetical protein DHW22_04425 [Planctomycetaceae bacterium]|nr:hypothetical protein [Planctomycetaceae bacterium]